MVGACAPPASGSHRRELLGADDVRDAVLAAMVADLWQVPDVVLLDSRAEAVAYDVPSILTGARTWVHGHADAGAGPRGFTLFVKRVHSWRHSPAFASVPPEVADWAAASLPWRAEHLVYGSGLATRLPEGLSMPRALHVEERPDDTAVLWLETIEHDPAPWDRDSFTEAAELLGRLSGSSRVAELADPDPQPWSIHSFVQGRIAHTVLPGLHDDATWQHPLVARHFGGLRAGLIDVAGRLDSLAGEYAGLRHLASHGDACPNNLLRRPGIEGFTLIDFGFWRSQPVGFDLSQLLVGDLQIGRRDADDLPELAGSCLRAYDAGLAAEGLDVPSEELRRAHAVSLMLFNGLPSLPLELLTEAEALADAGELTEGRRGAMDHWSQQRAAIARYALDVLADTEPSP